MIQGCRKRSPASMARRPCAGYYTTSGSGFNRWYPRILLLDAGELPVALDILSPFLTDRERAAKASAIEARSPKAWAWETAQGVASSGGGIHQVASLARVRPCYLGLIDE